LKVGEKSQRTQDRWNQERDWDALIKKHRKGREQNRAQTKEIDTFARALEKEKKKERGKGGVWGTEGEKCSSD